MAVKSTCEKCSKRFSAPEEYLGKRVDCPRCGHRAVLRSMEERRREEEREAERLRKLEEDREKLALIERMELRRRRTTRPYHETFGIEETAVRHFNPGAPSRFLRFRVLSEILLFSAYVEALLVLMGIGLTIYLRLDGTIPSIPILLLCLTGWVIVGVVLFLALKFLGELAFALSDMGDQQRDVVRLLLDLRDNTDARHAQAERSDAPS